MVMQLLFSLFTLLGDPSLPVISYSQMIAEAIQFILACYNLSAETMTEARVESWTVKMRRNTLEPPNVICTFLLAVWRRALQPNPPCLNPTDHGWSQLDDSTTLISTVVPLDTPLDPEELIKVLKCGCRSSTSYVTSRHGAITVVMYDYMILLLLRL